MAVKKIKYDPFKRGDTPMFAFVLKPPIVGWDWIGIIADCAITNVAAPSDNTGAGVLRLNQMLTVNPDNTASFNVQPTVAESKALTAGATYNVEVQLKSDSDTHVATASTGTVLVLQDYVI